MKKRAIEPGNQKRTCCSHSPSFHSSITNQFPRETASKILNEYLEKVGGKEKILAAWQEKKDATKKRKKRSRASTGAEATNGTKRGKKNGHPKDESPPASASKAEWKPPTGSWEEHVTGIDACEGNDNNVVVYLTWKGGHKTQHPLAAVYKRCPQKMLKFYESHLFVPPALHIHPH
jgi:chromobox protein 1